MASAKPHAIMVCFHLQGHITPFVNLALKLASKGFTITFAHQEFIHHKISRSEENDTDIFSKARSSGLDIHYTTYSDGLPVDFDRDANIDLHLETFLHILPGSVDELVGRVIKSSPSDNHFLIADTFCIWPAKIAKKYSLANVSFWTEPALVFSLYYHWELLRQRGHFPVNGQRVTVDYLPGIKSINTRDFMSYLHEKELNLMHEILFGSFDKVREADFILCNTVHELEAETISALQQRQPFYAIGPIFLNNSTKNLVATSLLPESESTVEWLSDKKQGSVLYVSFGSLAKTDERMILAIAGGLLLSGVSFIWVLRPGLVNSDVENILPVGFEEHTRGQGLIVPWCDQIRVLSDPAVGGFLTHCGWNSILESVWCGVPMICYPLFTDQITNRKLVVDDWRVGINLCDHDGDDDVIPTKEGVCEKIKHLMSVERYEDLRREIENVRRIMQNSSSEEKFESFVKDLSAEILNKKNLRKM